MYIFLTRAVFRHIVVERGLQDRFIKIDSFGTGAYHVGDSADRRSVEICRKNGVAINHRSQQIWPDHFTKFDYLLAMDHSNLDDLKDMAPRNSKAKIQLFGDYRNDKQYPRTISDPYYGGIRGFEMSFQQLSHFTQVFLDEILDES